MNPDSPHAETLIGTILEGVYRIDSLLGVGGMGAVYGAMHLRLDKRVAVKVMSRELAENSEALVRFRREAVVTGGLGNPHIVQVFDFGAAPNGQPFLVMEFLDGEDLDHRLRRVRRLGPRAVVDLVKQVASALAASHEKGVVHRDLKPANIYLLKGAGATDFVKVLDFGISKVLAATTRITRTSSVVGSPNYMSPEQAEGKVDEIDERTDQWALGCIAWECLSGACLYVGDSTPAILYQIVHKPLPSLARQVKGLPPQVEAVLVRALAKDKRDRFATLAEFAAAFEVAVVGTTPATASDTPLAPIVAPTVEVPALSSRPSTTFGQSAGETEASKGRRPPWRFLTVSVAAIVVLIGAALLWLAPRTTHKPTAASPPPVAAQPPPAPPVRLAPPPSPTVAQPPAVAPAKEPPAPEPVTVGAETIPPANKAGASAPGRSAGPRPKLRRDDKSGTRQGGRPPGPLNDDL